MSAEPQAAAEPDNIVVADNPDHEQYELTVNGSLAGVAAYDDRGSVRSFYHTEVKPAFRGRQLGDRLARFALQDCKERGLTVVPGCSFIRRFLEANKAEFGSLLEGRGL